MKPFIIIGFILYSVCFFSFCSSLEKQPGSIARQADLIEDLANKLPEEERTRFRKFLDNIKIDERLSDVAIQTTKESAQDAQELATERSADAGKWYGIRNLYIGAVIIALGFFAWRIFLKVTTKI
ncbi:hypothetical protein [Leptospira ilyithenensis]|uniref:Uncharacterized protein n=1 Tax=Leptospira ilyithenensis TaxID=2484901 RepID=A0A4R9LRK3_9LEPT|nr:hypothetical protein [Leptospira ilyithenensis]TGN09757.1 hypothetical protein EHS11_11790 [Leptospira ilyithenensis]